MNKILKWMAKKYAVSTINNLLEEYKSNVEKVTKTLDTWIARLEKVLNLLRCLSAKVDDGKIDDEEVEESLDQISNLVKQW